MPQFFPKILGMVKEKWAKMSKNQKVMLITSLTLIFVAISSAIYITSRPSYVNLFTGLDPKETAEIKKILDDQNISNQVISGGTIIKVRTEEYEQAKMAAALSGYPKNEGITFEDALKITSSMTATETDKRRTFIKLKESEIANSLKEMSDYISDATVHLSIPEDYLFALNEQGQKPTASVKLTLKKILSSVQIEGIQKFVAASVEGLDSSNVVIIDNKGNYLSENDSTLEGNANKALQIKIATQNEMEKQIKELLGSFVSSPEDVKVSINLAMNFDMQKVSETQYEPVVGDNGVVVSKRTINEEVKNGTPSQGVPGTDTNPTQNTTQYTLSNQTENSSYTKSDETVNYQNNEKKIETIKSPGTIDYDKSSIAVVLYRYKTYRQEDYEKSQQVKNLSWEAFKLQNANDKRSFLTNQSEVENIINIIKNATGISTVKVEGYEIPEFLDSEKKGIPTDYIYLIFSALLLLTFLIVILSRGMKTKKAPQMQFATPEGATFVESVPVQIAETVKSGDKIIEEINLEEFGEGMYEKQLDKLIKEKPELVAQLLRNWLSEEWE